MIIAIVKDLFFASKIKETASQLSKSIIFIKNYAELNNLLDYHENKKDKNPIALMIIDLNFNEMRPLETIIKIKNNEELKNAKIIAYCSHVQTDLIKKAKKIGAESIPKSLFTKKLPEIIKS